MNIWNNLKDYIRTLDPKTFYRNVLIFIFVLLAILGLLSWRQYAYIDGLKSKIKSINFKRKEAREILKNFESVNLQKRQVDEILAEAESENFRITKFMIDLIAELGLKENNTKEPEPVEEDIDEEYKEIRIATSFVNLNMQQLCNLLNIIDQNEKVYTKDLIITKVSKKPFIDVTLEIATLRRTG